MNIAAAAVAEAILGAAIASAQKVERAFWARASERGRFKDEHFQDIVAEFVYVFLHLCDREAFEAIPEAKKRTALLDSVFSYVLQFGTIERMTDDHPVPAFTRREERKEPGILFITQGMELLNDRQAEYSRLKLFAAQDEPQLTGTLFWEFGNLVAKTCGRYEHCPSIQLEAAVLASGAYIELIPVFAKMREPPQKSAGGFP